MGKLVMKFGGTSVGSADALRHVIQIVHKEQPRWENVIVVTSAMGGVTNKLVAMVDSAIVGQMDDVAHKIESQRERHLQIVHEFIQDADEVTRVEAHINSILAGLAQSCQDIASRGQADGHLRDAVLSIGEQLMAPILAAILRQNQLPAEAVSAKDIIVTDRRYQNAQPQFEPSRRNAQHLLTPLLKNNQIPVISGYIGSTPEGQITTLGRGGSDYSAAYVGSLIDADEVWIWTDVDGVMSADPRKIKNAIVIEKISYQQVSEFAYFGAKVLHPRTMEPLVEPHIPLYVRNTFNHNHPGTRINGASADSSRHLSAVTAIDGLLVFLPSVTSDMASADIPTLPRITKNVLSEIMLQETYPVITMESHAGLLFCYVVPTTARRTAQQESIEALAAAFKKHYPNLDGWRVEPISIVAAIGVVDIKQTMQVLNAVKAVRANLLAMGHGSPECSLFVVPPHEALRVLKRLHSMAVAVQSNLPYAENDPALPPTPSIPSIPSGRKRRSRPSGKMKPPHRTIPL